LGNSSARRGPIAVKPEQKAEKMPAVKIVKLSISPARKELFANERVALRVLGRYSDQSEKPIVRDLQWQISDPTIAAIASDGQLSGIRRR
jgi:hypothetical protein